MIDHPELELLSAFLDGELDETERARIGAHLPSCAECGATLDALRATVEELRALEPGEPSEQDSWALRSALAAARMRERKRPGSRVVIAVASAAAVIAAITFSVMRPSATLHRGSAGAGGVAAGPAAPPVQNYDASSARALLAAPTAWDSGNTATSGEALTVPNAAAPVAAEPGSATGADNQFSSRSGGGKAATPVPSSRPDCESAVAPGDGALVRTFQANFESKLAYFYIFAVPRDKPTRLELWVTSPTCETRFFAQRALKK